LIIFFKKLLDEYVSKKKLKKQLDKKNQSFIDPKTTQGAHQSRLDNSMRLQAKLEYLKEILKILREQFLYLKLTDISYNIRELICDYIIKMSKHNFRKVFDDRMVKNYKLLLCDESSAIKSK